MNEQELKRKLNNISKKKLVSYMTEILISNSAFNDKDITKEDYLQIVNGYETKLSSLMLKTRSLEDSIENAVDEILFILGWGDVTYELELKNDPSAERISGVIVINGCRFFLPPLCLSDDLYVILMPKVCNWVSIIRWTCI